MKTNLILQVELDVQRPVDELSQLLNVVLSLHPSNQKGILLSLQNVITKALQEQQPITQPKIVQPDQSESGEQN